MSKEIERISVNKFEMALGEDNVVEEILSGTDDVKIQIKKIIALPEMISFVQEVVESCIDNETGEYLPEAYDFAIRVGVLTRYANFTMPANMEKQYMLVYGTGAFDQVLLHINNTQFNDIVRAIDKKIKFMLEVISSSAVTKINDVINKLGEIASAGEKAFEGVDADNMAKVIQGVSKLGDMSEEDVAKVILEAQKTGENNG